MRHGDLPGRIIFFAVCLLHTYCIFLPIPTGFLISTWWLLDFRRGLLLVRGFSQFASRFLIGCLYSEDGRD